MTSLLHLDVTQPWIRSPNVPLRTEGLTYSHYASPIPSECALVFGHLHPELFWEYILAVRLSYTLIHTISLSIGYWCQPITLAIKTDSPDLLGPGTLLQRPLCQSHP